MIKLYEIKFDEPVKLESFKEGLRFSNGLTITDYHKQDCCESVYADWQQLEDTGILKETFKKLTIKANPAAGIVFNGYLVPCYNYQNGYYSSELQLEIAESGIVKHTIDISEYVEDHIN